MLLFTTLYLALVSLVTSQDTQKTLIVYPEDVSDCNQPVNHGDMESGITLYLDEALQQLESFTTLSLQPGPHCIREFRMMQELVNVTIVGDGSATIKCASDRGLAFLQSTNLTLTNITIDNCGFLGSSRGSLQTLIRRANETLNIFHRLPDDGATLSAAVFMADCKNCDLMSVNITNSPGIGLLGINIIGQSQLVNNNYVNNSAVKSGDVGGGLYLLYIDYRHDETIDPPGAVSLTVIDSNFYNNANLNYKSANLPIYVSDSVTAHEYGFVFNPGGGLGVTMAQHTYTVSMEVNRTVFRRNRAFIGGGVHIAEFIGVNGSRIDLFECIFDSNGLGIGTEVTLELPIGAAVGIIMNLKTDEQLNEQFVVNSFTLRPNTINFDNCSFFHNNGYYGSGVHLASLQNPLAILKTKDLIVIRNCTFRRNIAILGAVIGAVEFKFSSTDPGTLLVLNSVNVTNNIAAGGPIPDLYSGSSKAMIFLLTINATITGNCIFAENNNTIITAVTSMVNFINTTTRFINNSAAVGGAFQFLDSSYMVLKNNTAIEFINNSASVTGGAIYVDLLPTGLETSLFDNCFMWFDHVDKFCLTNTTCALPFGRNITVSFQGNTARLGGTIFGSTLSTCRWIKFLSGMENIIDLDNRFGFSFDPSLTNGSSVISTEVMSLTLTSDDNPIPVKPGESVRLNVSAFDSLNQSIPLVITSSVVRFKGNTTTKPTSRLGLSGYWLLQQDFDDVDVVATFQASRNTSAVISLVDIDGRIRQEFDILVRDCGFGFKFSSQNNSCICDNKKLDPFKITCDLATSTLTVPDGVWVGRASAIGDVVHYCILDYCGSGEKRISDDNFSGQCANNYKRTGLLCSQCQPNSSIVFGSSQCRECSNAYIGFVVVFVLLGIVLIVFISLLDFTITHGYLNSIIFYSNVLNVYYTYLSPSDNDFLFVPIAILNLNIGFELCFYDGMTALAKTGLQLMFPAYLFLLMFVVIFLARRSQWVSNRVVSAPKMITTLLLLCYTNVGSTCVEIFGFTPIEGDDRQFYTGWIVDPAVPYGSGWHGLLVFLSILIMLFYVIPFTIILFIPPTVVLRLRWGNKFLPIFDAFWGAFKPKMYFWLAFRCLVRIVVYSFAFFAFYPTNVFFTTIIILVILFVQEQLQPFKLKHQNIIESLFSIHLIVLLLGSLSFADAVSSRIAQIVCGVILMLLAYLLMIVIFGIHVHLRFPKLKLKIKNALCYCCRRWQRKKRYGTLLEQGDSSVILVKANHTHIMEDSVQGKPLNTASTPTSSELREPLLDEGSVALEPLPPLIPPKVVLTAASDKQPKRFKLFRKK